MSGIYDCQWKKPKSRNEDFTLGRSRFAVEHIRWCRTWCGCRCSHGLRWRGRCYRGRSWRWHRGCRNGCGFRVPLFRTAGFPVTSFVRGSTGCSPDNSLESRRAAVHRPTGTSATLSFLPRIAREQLLHGVAGRGAPKQHRADCARDRHVDALFGGERFDRRGGVHALRDVPELLEDRV